MEPRLLLSATAFDETPEPLTTDDQSIGVLEPTSLPGVDLTWTPADSSNYKATNRAASDIRWLIFHTTEATADSVIATCQTPNSYLSYHYLIRQDGTLVQLVADDDAAYHSGNNAYDRYSIGIAMERYGSNSVTDAQETTAFRLVWALYHAYDMGIRYPDGIAPADPTTRAGVIGHNQVPDPANPALGGGSMHATDPTNWDFDYFRRYRLDLPPRNVKPEIGSITGVVSGSGPTQTLTLTAHDVTDRDGEVSKVEFYHDYDNNGALYPPIDELLGTDSDGSDGWSFTIFIKDLHSSGNRGFSAIAYDNDNGPGYATMIKVNIVKTFKYVIEYNGVVINEGDQTPSTADGTDFGSVKQYQSVTHTFTIRNLGNTWLFFDPIESVPILNFVSHTAVNVWSFTQYLDKEVAPGESTTFKVRFSPQAVSYYRETVEINGINNTGTGGSRFRFDISGRGLSLDSTRPTVTVNQASTQSDPAQTGPILFDVQFSESVTGFSALDLKISGTSGANQGIVTGTGSKYQVAVSGMTQEGTVILTFREEAAKDAAGNWSYAPTSTDNTVWYSPAPPVDNAPNTWRKALNLGRLDLQQPSSLIDDYVGPEDRKDWYRFRITSKSLTKVAVVNNNGNSDLKLYRKNNNTGKLDLVATSVKAGDANELIKRKLGVGWYFAVVIAPANAATDYRFVTRLLDTPAAASAGGVADAQYLTALASAQLQSPVSNSALDLIDRLNGNDESDDATLLAQWLQ